MNIGSTQPQVQAPAAQAPSGVDNKRLQLQAILLRKALDSQQQQAGELTRELEGKGQIIDLRV